MIEIETKYFLTPEQEKKLLKDATFVGQETLTDIYYDTKDYTLSLNDLWIRTRNGVWTLKVPCQKNKNYCSQSRYEISDEQEIKRYLAPFSSTPLKPLYTIIKKRTKYTKEGFTIDLDTLTSPSLDIPIKCEIELMVEREDQVPLAHKELNDFAKRNGLIHDISQDVREKGSLIGIIRYVNPEHYKLLKRKFSHF
jgi:predicted adenylyl cyclase CyaB